MMAFNDINPDELDQMQEDAAQKAASAKKYAALMDARASGSNAVTLDAGDGQTNVPEDQATSRQPGSSRIADMFKSAATPGENASSDPSSTTSIVSRPDFTRRDMYLKAIEKTSQEDPGFWRASRQAHDRKMRDLVTGARLEEQKASGDLGAQQKYQTFFDPKRQGVPLQGRGSPNATQNYFQDVFRRDPVTGEGDLKYEDTGVQTPIDIRKQVMARGGAAGGMVVTPTGDGGYATETYDNRPEPRALPGGGTKSVPGGYVDAQGTFHGTVPQTATGKGRPAYPAAVINGYNAIVQTQGKDAANAYLNEWEDRLGTEQAGGQPTVSAPSPGLRPAAPAGARGQVTPQGPAATPPGPGGLKATSHNPQTGQFAAQGPDGKWVTWGGAPAVQRGMGR